MTGGWFQMSQALISSELQGLDPSLFCLLSPTGAVWVFLLPAGCPGLSQSSGAASQGGSCAMAGAGASVESASAKWQSLANTTVRSASATTGCVRPTTGKSAQVRKPWWWQKLRKLGVYIKTRNTARWYSRDMITYGSLKHRSKRNCGHIQGFCQIKGYKLQALCLP